MPRGFTEKEFKFYKNRLLEIGTDLFGKKGISGVSLDSITQKAGIAKGSFYKFFKSKEDLCFDALMKLEEEIRIGLEERLTPFKKDPGILMKKLIKEVPAVIEEHPLIKMFQNPKDMQSLLLRVDPKKQQENFNGDSLFIGRILEDTTILKKSDLKSITAFVWALVFLSMNKSFLNDQFDNVIDLIGEMAGSHFD